MAKFRKKDCGLEHVQRLGIRPGNNPDAVTKSLIDKYGKSEGLKLNNYIFSQKNNGLNQADYDRKNENYEDAMLITGLYDGDIIRRACNWIDDHAEAFGQQILEVGCDCGFMTTFLASRFPNSTIVALDLHESGIAIAQKNSDKLGLTNIKFVQGDLSALAGQQFDTVFSMRALQENGGAQEWTDQIDNLKVQAQKKAENLKDYANSLAALLAPQGQIVSIERMEREPLFLAWIMALQEAGCNLDVNSHQELLCQELGQDSVLQAMVFSRAEQQEQLGVFDAFIACCAHNLDMSLEQYAGWDAEVMYEVLRGELIKGYLIEDIKRGDRDKITLCQHAQDPNSLVFCRVYGDRVSISIHEKESLEKALAAVEGGAQQAAKDTYHKVTELTEG